MNNEQDENGRYALLLDELSQILNGNGDISRVKPIVQEISQEFKIELSKEFLKGLIKGENRQISNKLYSACKGLGFEKVSFKPRVQDDYTKGYEDIIEYSIFTQVQIFAME